MKAKIIEIGLRCTSTFVGLRQHRDGCCSLVGDVELVLTKSIGSVSDAAGEKANRP